MKSNTPITQLKKYFFIATIGWTMLIGFIFIFDVRQLKEFTLALAKDNAYTTIDRDIAFRQWSTSHGGVYVQIDKNTPPNPYLKVPNRDINASGKQLTLMNPAYMIRQASELTADMNITRTHITSTNPLRPENMADEWEQKAIKSFNAGKKEASELVNDGKELRVMKVFITEKGCLKCHGHQGYNIGDVRGGISVTVNMIPYIQEEEKNINSLIISYLVIWLIGAICAVVAYVLFRRIISTLIATENELSLLNKELSERVETETKKRLEKETLLIQQSKMAMMGEMIAMIAHQWRQPLNVLAINIQDVGMAYDSGELDKTYINGFKSSSMQVIKKMSKTIDDFREYFKPENKKEDFEVGDAISQTLLIIGPLLRNKGIQLNYTENSKHRIYGYKSLLEQVLIVLLSNARDALMDTKTDNPFINLSVEGANDGVKIIVEDNGGGIPSDIMERIFEPYFTTKEQGKGTGIGLYMAQEIVEKHMGGVIVAKNTNSGACFEIILPS